jgi:hypothetical protein
MIVLVCGGRNYGRVKMGTPAWMRPDAAKQADRERFMLREALDQIHRSRRFTKVIDGAASGADGLAHEWAKSKGIKTQRFRADWRLQGRAAGPIRNAQMLRDGNPDLVIAFPGGDGTADMMRQARAAGVQVMDLGGSDD